MKKLDRDPIQKLYKSGLSARQVAKELGISTASVFTVLQELKISRNKSESQLIGCERKVAVPLDFSFQNLDPDKAWLLGIIFGDGSISKQGYTVSITSGDDDIIEHIIRIVGTSAKPSDRGTYKTICINSRRLVIELITFYGLHHNKSKTMKMPFLGDESLVNHFHRGLLDSDGCFSIDKRCSINKLLYSYVTASIDFAESVSEDLKSFCSVSLCRKIGVMSTGAYQVRFNNQDAVAIGEWLYSNSAYSARCERKYNIFKQFVYFQSLL